MTDRLPPENSSANGQNDERVKRLKQASRLIVTTREKMPHSALWHQSLRRTLWRYTQEMLLKKRNNQSDLLKRCSYSHIEFAHHRAPYWTRYNANLAIMRIAGKNEGENR